MELSSTDYKKITQFYHIPKSTHKSYKEVAEDVLASKLCKCIKKVRSNKRLGESAAIGICRNSIFKKRRIDFSNFKCKKGHKLLSRKGNRSVLHKFRNKIDFNKTKKIRKH